MPSEIESIRPNLSLQDVAKEWLKSKLSDIEERSDKDVLTIYGDITTGVDIRVRMAIEGLQERRKTLLVILHTNGGVIEEVRNIVQILRNHYEDVHFLVPVCAMSAGTVLALSGDEIYMDYFSRLGPIDPQLPTGNGMVPALSYLHQYERLIESSRKGELSSAEMILLNKLDLAQLHQFELAANLSVSLIADWLTKYKFKNWNKSETRKKQKAREIAEALNDHQKWYTHGSSIHKDILELDLGLEINDYSEDSQLKQVVWGYFWSLAEYAGAGSFIHSRAFI
ncbi:MAG: serine dehydrogenasease [Gammaproteobacteria bacterium]|nr:serine dehydrogenasease [Gammaproteobacteria bacterium]